MIDVVRLKTEPEIPEPWLDLESPTVRGYYQHENRDRRRNHAHSHSWNSDISPLRKEGTWVGIQVFEDRTLPAIPDMTFWEWLNNYCPLKEIRSIADLKRPTCMRNFTQKRWEFMIGKRERLRDFQVSVRYSIEGKRKSLDPA